MKTIQKTIFFIFLLSLICHQNRVLGQEKTDSVAEITPTLSLVYVCNSNDTINLTANLFVRRETGNFALENAEIEFNASSDKETRLLGKVKSDYTGTAIFKVFNKSGLPVDKEGKTTYTASFAGKGNYLPVSENITFKKARLLITFSKVDSIRTIHVKATQIEANNVENTLPNETVGVYIPMMLSNLKIGEITLDDTGNGSIEYPGSFVGDSLGNITILAMIEENDMFGTVKGKSSISWGIPKQYYLAEKPTRELWTPVAPIWMIITLIVMLTGVWAHYLYAVIQLIMIKRHSKEQKNYF